MVAEGCLVQLQESEPWTWGSSQGEDPDLSGNFSALQGWTSLWCSSLSQVQCCLLYRALWLIPRNREQGQDERQPHDLGVKGQLMALSLPPHIYSCRIRFPPFPIKLHWWELEEEFKKVGLPSTPLIVSPFSPFPFYSPSHWNPHLYLLQQMPTWYYTSPPCSPSLSMSKPGTPVAREITKVVVVVIIINNK